MQSDWDSLFFTYRPHADQRPHEDHLLRDVGLVRTALGEIALAEDPTSLVNLDRPGPLLAFWRRAWQALRASPRSTACPDGVAMQQRASSCGQ